MRLKKTKSTKTEVFNLKNGSRKKAGKGPYYYHEKTACVQNTINWIGMREVNEKFDYFAIPPIKLEYNCDFFFLVYWGHLSISAIYQSDCDIW